MALEKKNFANKSLKQEIQVIGSLVFLFGFMLLAIIIGIVSNTISFDNREKAAGKVYFVENNTNLQQILDQAVDSDAIFIKVGSYTTSDSRGFVIKNKNIRVLGAGTGFVTVLGNNNSNVFYLENASVRFESLKLSGANKEGVLVKNNGQKEVSLKDVQIVNNSGAAIKSDSPITLMNSLINQNGSGIEAQGNLTVENTVIQNSADFGINHPANSKGNLTVKNVVLTNNKGKAINANSVGANSIKNVTIYNNGTGIIETGSTSTEITNTIVQKSAAEGISLKNSNAKVIYTNAFNNGSGDFVPSTFKSQEGNTSVDSQFVSETDLHLKATSPLVNAGLKSEFDNDGSIIDLGAFGGNPDLNAVNFEPTVSSTPERYAQPNKAYSYEVKATDPDKDQLSYIVLNTQSAPKWLKQENNKFSGTPSQSDIGFAGILLLVTDKKGHNVIHPISINVIGEDKTVPTDTPTTTPTPTEKLVPKIKFINPVANAVFTPESRQIKWEVTNKAEVEKFVIKYSEDKENFTTLATLKGDETSYTWDISKLVEGSYVLKLEATSKSDSTVVISEMSEQFTVKPTSTTPTNPTQGNVSITRNSPADNDNVKTRRETILVEFKPEAELDQSKTYLKVNNQNVDYKFTKSSIFFEPKADLTGSRTQVEVKIVTKEGAETSRRWTFTLPVVSNPQDTTVAPVVTQTILGLPRVVGLILIALIVLALLLLLLYFVFKLLRTIRQERQGNLESEFTEYYSTPVSPLQQTTIEEKTTYVPVAPVVLENTTVKTETVESTPTTDMVTTPILTENTITKTEVKETVLPKEEADYLESLKNRYNLTDEQLSTPANAEMSQPQTQTETVTTNVNYGEGVVSEQVTTTQMTTPVSNISTNVVSNTETTTSSNIQPGNTQMPDPSNISKKPQVS